MTDKYVKLVNSVMEYRKISYEGTKLTENRKDLTFMGVNTQFLAIVPVNDGASFVIWPLVNTQGKVTNFVKHKCEATVVSIDFDPFHSTRVIVGCENGKFRQWHLNVDSDTATDPVAEYEFSFNGTPVQALFHPSASDVAFLVNSKGVICANVGDGKIIREMEQSCGEILSASLSIDGTKIACSYSDEKVRIHSLKDMSVLYVAKVSAKRHAVQYLVGLTGDFLAVSMKSDNRRIVKIIKADVSGKFGESNPDESSAGIYQGETSTSTKKFSMIYDPDLNVLILSTAGETAIYIVHLADDGSIFEAGALKVSSQSIDPVKSLIGGPKYGINPVEKELLRIYKAGKSGVEVYNFMHPRKNATFDAALYPPTFSYEPAMTVEEFMSGKVSEPKRMDMEALFQECKKSSSMGRTMSLIGSSGERLSTSPLSIGSGSSDFDDLKKKVESLETKVKDLSSRLEAVEKK